MRLSPVSALDEPISQALQLVVVAFNYFHQSFRWLAWSFLAIQHIFFDLSQVFLRLLLEFKHVFLRNIDFWIKLSLIKGRLSNAGLQLGGELLLEPPELLVALLWRLFHSFLDFLGESVDFVAQLFFGPEHQEGSRARLLFFCGDCYFEAPYPHLPIVDDVTLLGDPEPLETAQQNLSEFL